MSFHYCVSDYVINGGFQMNKQLTFKCNKGHNHSSLDIVRVCDTYGIGMFEWNIYVKSAKGKYRKRYMTDMINYV